MDISSIANMSTSMATTGLQQQVGIAVLKKAQDMESSAASALIAAIPSGNLPSHLGQNVNTVA
jgi:hypothetical protein